MKRIANLHQPARLSFNWKSVMSTLGLAFVCLSSPDGASADLDVAARDGIAKCKFRPGTFEGKPSDGWLMLQYVWTLD